jgi:hypothetical protein
LSEILQAFEQAFLTEGEHAELASENERVVGFMPAEIEGEEEEIYDTEGEM